jgi:hypothetical protein
MKIKLNFLNTILILTAISISVLIFTHKSLNTTIIRNLFETMTNHISINDKEKEVANENILIKLNEYTYTNDSYSVYCPFKATVIDTNDNNIILKCDNDYYAYFENVINVNVNKFDYVDSYDELANFEDCFTMYFYKEGIKCSYEEIIRSN